MEDIESGCTLEMSANDTAEIDNCMNAGKALFEEVDKCLKPSKTLDESCTCFGELTKDNLDKVKGCNITAKNNMAKEAKKMCTSGEYENDDTLSLLTPLGQGSVSARRRRTQWWTSWTSASRRGSVAGPEARRRPKNN